MKIFIKLYHPSEELVNLILSVSEVTTFYIMIGLLTPSTIWCIKLETHRQNDFDIDMQRLKKKKEKGKRLKQSGYKIFVLELTKMFELVLDL